MLKSSNRLWAIGTAVLCAVLLVAAYLLLIAPKRAQAADLATQQESVAQSNTQLQAHIEQLKAEAKTLPQRQAELAVIQGEMTPVTDMSQLTRDLQSLANESGLQLAGITPTAPVRVDTSGTGTAAAGSTGSTTAGSTGSTAAGATGGSATGATGATGSATAAGGTTQSAAPSGPVLVAVPMHVIVHGDYFQAALFVKKVQTQLTRLVLIGGVTTTATSPDAKIGDPENGIVDMDLSAQIYIYQVPRGGAGTGTASATGNSANGTSTPTSTSTVAPTTTSVENR